MTKKTNASESPAVQKTSDTEPVQPIKRPRGRPRKDASLPAKEKLVKGTLKKGSDAKNENAKPARRGRKPKLKPDSEVEMKVREIVKKTQSKTLNSEEKKESSNFTLEDVRAIIESRKVEKAPSKPKKLKKNTVLPTIKDEPKKNVKTAKVKKLQTASIDDILGFGVSLGPTRPIRDESNVPKELESYYYDLMTLRHSLKGALGQRSSETLGASARESSGESSINSSDSGSESFNRDVALSMVATEQEALEEIEDAIDRIFDGSFGICQETQNPIKKARLKVVPFTRFSLEGQTLFEKRNRKERDSGGGIFATISDSTLGEDD
jgi:RNA polymerase-binding transcription factor DksA